MILLQPYVVRQFYLLQIPVTVVQDLARSHYRTCGARNKPRSGMLYRRRCDNADTNAKIQLNHAVLAFFLHPSAMTPMGAITPMGALARMITVPDSALVWRMRRLTRDGTGRLNPSREAKFSGANGDREMLIFPTQLNTSRIGNFTRLIHTLALSNDHTYIHTAEGTPTQDK